MLSSTALDLKEHRREGVYACHRAGIPIGVEQFAARGAQGIAGSLITENHKVPKEIRIFSVVATGGMGKSALIGARFEDITPGEFSKLAGRLRHAQAESFARKRLQLKRITVKTARLTDCVGPS